MTSKRHSGARRPLGAAGILAGVVACALAGCLGPDDNVIESGLTAHLAEMHGEALPGVVPLEPGGIPDGPLSQGGYSPLAEHHVIVDGVGNLVSVYRAYLGLGGLELVRCPTVAGAARRALDGLADFLVPAAFAHAGHGSEPVGGRGLDRANVIDIVSCDEFRLALGDVSLAPGTFCGARLALSPIGADAYGLPDPAPESADDPTTVPEVPDLTGLAFALRADYCDQVDGLGQCTHRVKVAMDDAGLILPAGVEVDFAAPLTLSAAVRQVYAAVGAAYGDWLADVDATTLAADAAARQLVLDAVGASLHVREAGLGGLPPNTP